MENNNNTNNVYTQYTKPKRYDYTTVYINCETRHLLDALFEQIHKPKTQIVHMALVMFKKDLDEHHPYVRVFKDYLNDQHKILTQLNDNINEVKQLLNNK